MTATLQNLGQTTIPSTRLSALHAPNDFARTVRKRAATVFHIAPQTHTRLLHPKTKLAVFGHLPAIDGGKIAVGIAPVFLTFGRQGKGNGMGALHIWNRHGGNLAAFGVNSVDTVSEFVAQVIRPGTSLYWQESSSDQIRIAAYRKNIGTVILGHRIWGTGPRWEVITAFDGEPWEGPRCGEIS